MCAHAVSVAIEGVPGVESVQVSLNQGKATIRLQPGNSVHLEELVQKVRDNGFTPKEARVVVHGKLVSSGDRDGKLELLVSGINQAYQLILDSQTKEVFNELRKQLGRCLRVEGVVPIPKDGKLPNAIHVRKWEKLS